MRLRDLLCGGDRRSLARAGEALAIAREDPDALAELARLAYDPDPLVAQRACDTLEKLLKDRIDWVQPHKHVFLDQIASPFWETRLQCVRAVSQFDWTEDETAKVIEALRPRILDEQKFVRCWALDSFSLFAEIYPELIPELDAHISEFLRSGVPSMQARARAIVRRLKL